MGIFDKIDDSFKVSSLRNPDTTGTYWQRIDSVDLFETRKYGEALRISKTTVKVLADPAGRAQPAGASTSEVVFQDDYLTRTLKLKAQALLGLTAQQADELTGQDLQEIFLGDRIIGEVVEVRATEKVSKKGNPFTEVTWVRRVSPELLEESLTEAEKAQFYPEGVTA
ncbi:MAG: hypothetical protein D6812_04460 [Deltaproteobacteria bacterium]|nr:MAG: hypothetical protein D6812_04460 [Deltaproteobacteria bacterium]